MITHCTDFELHQMKNKEVLKISLSEGTLKNDAIVKPQVKQYDSFSYS